MTRKNHTLASLAYKERAAKRYVQGANEAAQRNEDNMSEQLTTEKKETKKKNWFQKWGWIVLVILLVASAIALIWHPWVPAKTETPAVGCSSDQWRDPNNNLLVFTDQQISPDNKWQCIAVSPEEFKWILYSAPTVAPTNTEMPESTPEVAATAIPTTAPVSCSTPSIKAGETATETEFGEYLDTTLGRRMTFTSRKVVVPAKAWNDPLSAEELKSVEQTWLVMQVCVPEGMFGRVFAGGYEQGLNRFENGVLMTLQPGVYEFKIRNGEIVLWYPQQDEFATEDLDRIVKQIKNGNFDIKNALAFFGVTADILPKIPSELVKELNVQIVSAPNPE